MSARVVLLLTTVAKYFSFKFLVLIFFLKKLKRRRRVGLQGAALETEAYGAVELRLLVA